MKKYTSNPSYIILSADKNVNPLPSQFSMTIKFLSQHTVDYFREYCQENLPYAYPNTPFAESVKRARLKGERFYETLGILKK